MVELYIQCSGHNDPCRHLALATARPPARTPLQKNDRSNIDPTLSHLPTQLGDRIVTVKGNDDAILGIVFVEYGYLSAVFSSSLGSQEWVAVVPHSSVFMDINLAVHLEQKIGAGTSTAPFVSNQWFILKGYASLLKESSDFSFCLTTVFICAENLISLADQPENKAKTKNKKEDFHNR